MHDLVTDTLRRLADEAPDDELLRRFTATGDQDAFEALVPRTSPIVLAGVCRRLIGNPDGAEDTFQATFLILARRAASLTRPWGRLTGWLYGVARRVAARVRLPQATGSAAPSTRSPAPDPLAELTAGELLLVLEEEIVPAYRRRTAWRSCCAACRASHRKKRHNNSAGVPVR